MLRLFDITAGDQINVLMPEDLFFCFSLPGGICSKEASSYFFFFIYFFI